ncbi:MAG: bifunctional phosphopantothenoylcysteine decarboxylase/phosphopantothenate--cysteine ligase CoaBC [Candidatus Gastranaerophilales bacterium]|nr:bifunctional phosphopantothenoylcysteine decarboxylase/phosphopantothenate--cysteine ligase CoaBC [Candidatus Gastranaerophilales bacterium]
MLTGKNILIGITGAIAAYKTIELIRLFKKANANVKVVVTENAYKFVTKTTLQSLSQNEVFCNQYDFEDFKPEHISLAEEADVFLICPASANTISKIANGICDNLLTSIFCAFKKTTILAPCMNTGMWENTFIQENIKKLTANGTTIIEPQTGFLACGTEGKGRLADIDTIFESVKNILTIKKKLIGKKIIITAGGTKENIDPVRYIGNYSSGKMGLALADSAFEQGAEVTLISTFDINKPYNVIKAENADKMLKEVSNAMKTADSLIMAAAVSDYKVKDEAQNKIKKDNNEKIILELVQNPDILANSAKNKTPNQLVVGFCAESENLIENAKTKIDKKQCDFIIANDISQKDIGFSSDENEVYIIDKKKNITHIDKNSKKIIAEKIIEVIYG